MIERGCAKSTLDDYLLLKIPFLEEPMLYCELREVKSRTLSIMRPDAQVAVPTDIPIAQVCPSHMLRAYY